MQQIEIFIIRVDGVWQVRLVVLASSNKPLQDISCFKWKLVDEQVLWVKPFMIHVLIVDLDNGKKLQVASINILIFTVSGTEFKKTVKVIDIDDAESSISLPFEARSEYLQGLFILIWVPNSAYKVFWEIEVDELGFGFSNQKNFLLEVKVKLTSEVGWKEVWHACLLRETSREATNSIIYLPYYMLAFILVFKRLFFWA